MESSVIQTIPRPMTPGPETVALRRFHRNGTWKGTIREGGMGPGTPPQTASGRATHRWIQDGRWVVGEYEQDQFLLDGTFVLEWQLHWVCGWDPAHAEYRATIADNYGRIDVLRGRIEGDVMTFESMAGSWPRLRLTWDASGPDSILWRNEVSTDGNHWTLIEDYEIIPSDLYGLGENW